MTEAIRLIQGIVTPEQINEIVDWNKERNEFELNSDLEVNMLMEEVKEYFDAEEYVDKMDAVCDTIFVAVGTLAKSAYGYHIATKEILSPLDFVLTDFVGRTAKEGIDPQGFMPLVSDCLTAVIDANKEKGTEKDADGKVIKPEGFVAPEDRLAEIIENHKNIDRSEDVAEMFQNAGAA